MTYVYEYVVGNDNVKVEYCHSSITDSIKVVDMWVNGCLLYTSPSPRDVEESRMPSSA